MLNGIEKINKKITRNRKIMSLDNKRLKRGNINEKKKKGAILGSRNFIEIRKISHPRSDDHHGMIRSSIIMHTPLKRSN